MTDITDLPPHAIRVSSRARRIGLKVTPAKGLEVVLPEGADPAAIPQILHRHRTWIERHLARLEGSQEVRQRPPLQLGLQAVSEVWAIEYQKLSNGRPKVVERAGRSLLLDCEPTDTETLRGLLRDWSRDKARAHLVPMLEGLSDQTGLGFHRVQVKAQRTLWGSCSFKHSINLNYKLIFLPPDLVRYVLIHELCHTQHLNHSARFWTLVGSFEARHQELEAGLKDCSRHLPAFLE